MKHSLSKKRQRQIIERFMQVDLATQTLTRELQMTIPQLAQWASDAGNVAALDNLARLAEIRTQLLINSYRANAASQLIRIATADTSDLARKACIDFLKINLKPFERREFDDTPTAADEHADEMTLHPEALLAALETLGSQNDPNSPFRRGDGA